MTRDHEVTAAPADIVSALGLSVGQSYSLQVFSRDVVAHRREAASAPDVDDPAHVLVPRGDQTIKQAAGMGIYLWTVAGASAVVVVTEAV